MTDNYSEVTVSEPSMGGAPAVKWLLGLNVAVFLLQTTLVSPDAIYGTFGLDPAAFPAKWWTMVSYMFVHAGLLHLAMNMVTLWMFGTRLEEAWASRTFVYFYLWCGIGGAIAHLLFARNAGLVGASAAVSGVLMAYGLRWPEERVYLFGFFPTRSRWLVAWMIGINILIGLSAQTLIGWKAHLGGLAFGWLFLKARSPNGTSEDYAANGKALAEMRRATRPSTETTRGTGRSVVLNHVLDKISRSGLESLSQEERSVLQNASRELRGPAND